MITDLEGTWADASCRLVLGPSDRFVLTGPPGTVRGRYEAAGTGLFLTVEKMEREGWGEAPNPVEERTEPGTGDVIVARVSGSRIEMRAFARDLRLERAKGDGS